MCEQEVEVMEVALGSVFPILLSSGKLFSKKQKYFYNSNLFRCHMASRRNATYYAFS